MASIAKTVFYMPEGLSEGVHWLCYPDGFLPTCSALIHRARGLTQRFDKYENNVTRML